MSSDVSLSMPATLDTVARVRHVVAEVAGLADLPIDKLQLAVTEAVANVAMHAYQGCDGERPGPVRVHVETRDDGVVCVDVEDDGCGVRKDDPTRQNGYGVELMRTLADEFKLESNEHGTRVLLRFVSERPPSA
jgi:anti-sigma regulatory factor (Ser/Thr protein kinase)